MKPGTDHFIRAHFAAYYEKHDLVLPPDALQREWGIIPFSGTMRRHLGFGSPEEIREYLKAITPQHCYHSSAKWQDPGAPTMKDKGWIGTDLIFDLDVEFEPGVPYHVLIDRVKPEVVKLHTILTEELGFSDITIIFSGGRGYHLHVRDEQVQHLTGIQRLEFIDYIAPRIQYFDKAVTKDTTRLIRAPGSLHGKSALLAVVVADVTKFDPMVDAVAFNTSRRVTINTVSREVLTRIGGESRVLAPGDHQVSEAAALHLCCLGVAEIGTM